MHHHSRAQAFLLALSVVVCPMLEALVDSKVQPPRVWLAAGLAACGVFLLECGTSVEQSLTRGDLIGLAQPLFFGVGFYLTERAMHRHSRGAADAHTPIALTAWNLVAVAAMSAVWMLSSGTLSEVQLTATAVLHEPLHNAALIGAILWTGLVTTAGCSVAEAAALGELSSSDATVVFATEPLWGVAFANLVHARMQNPDIRLQAAPREFSTP